MDKPTENFGDPEELMPTPERLKKEVPIEVPVAEELLETPKRPPEPKIEAQKEKPIPTEAEIVEPGSLATIRARKAAHQAQLRR